MFLECVNQFQLHCLNYSCQEETDPLRKLDISGGFLFKPVNLTTAVHHDDNEESASQFPPFDVNKLGVPQVKYLLYHL